MQSSKLKIFKKAKGSDWGVSRVTINGSLTVYTIFNSLLVVDGFPYSDAKNLQRALSTNPESSMQLTIARRLETLELSLP